MSLNPDLLRVEFIGVTVRHEEVELPRDDLALLFASVSERYGLGRMEYHPDAGATLAGHEGAELVVRPGQTASCGTTGLGYREGRERVVGVLGEVMERYGAAPLWVEDVTLVAVWDGEDADAAREVLADGVLHLDADRLALLGGDELALGLRVWRRAEGSTLECAVEPMHAEPSKIYIRLVQSLAEPVADAAGVREAVDAVHEYLHGPLKAFVLARARR